MAYPSFFNPKMVLNEVSMSFFIDSDAWLSNAWETYLDSLKNNENLDQENLDEENF